MKNRDFLSKYFFVTIIFVSIISLSFGQDCDVGYVPDCADDDCCPESWIGDGFEDCEDQAFGCDLTCYDSDGGDCTGTDPYCGDGICDGMNETDETCPEDCTSHNTLQSMIDATECGGTLIVPEGDYYEHIIINKCISISAPPCPDGNCGDDGRAPGYRRVQVKKGSDIDLDERDDCDCDDVTLEGIEFFADSINSNVLSVLPHDDAGQSALSLTITNSIIDGNYWGGNGLQGSFIDELLITGSTITHSYTGVQIMGGSVVNHHINESSFIDNAYNINVSQECEGTFDATYNWWGSPEGPGNSVIGDVDTDIWYIDEEMTETNDDGVTGDLNGDGLVNVLDVVVLVNIVLGGTDPIDAGDLNGDGILNVLDVVVLVNMVLGGRTDGATSATFHVIGNEVTMTTNGYVGAIQMTLFHSENFTLTLTDDALVAQHVTEGSTTRLMIVEPAQSTLFTASGNFTIESVIAASNSESYMQTSISLPKEYSIGAAYPNPFNPITQMSLDLNTDSNVSVKIFNTVGQLIDIIAEGQMASGSYFLTWDGTNTASGVYLIRTEIDKQVHSQKIMLIK